MRGKFQEERKNILDEWGDDEEDESEEKKKINETLGRSSEDGSDDEGSVHGEGKNKPGKKVLSAEGQDKRTSG